MDKNLINKVLRSWNNCNSIQGFQIASKPASNLPNHHSNIVTGTST